MSQNNDEATIKRRENRGGRPLAERMRAFLDVPADLLCGGCYLELRGQGELQLQGCRRIAKYTADEMILRLRRGYVRVRGRQLVCTSYHAGKMVIGGWITAIDFIETEEHV